MPAKTLRGAIKERFVTAGLGAQITGGCWLDGPPPSTQPPYASVHAVAGPVQYLTGGVVIETPTVQISVFAPSAAAADAHADLLQDAYHGANLVFLDGTLTEIRLGGRIGPIKGQSRFPSRDAAGNPVWHVALTFRARYVAAP